MKTPNRDPLAPLHPILRAARERLDRFAQRDAVTSSSPTQAAPAAEDSINVEAVRQFQRRMSEIVDTVQAGVWARGVHELIGHATDFAVGQERGVQTLVLKTRRRSAYVRLDWDTVVGDSATSRQQVDEAISKAIDQLS